jgi:hypothetical protein
MIKAQIVPIELIHGVWPHVEQFLTNSLNEGTGDFDLEHLKVWLVNGEQALLIFVDDEKIVGCGTIKFINYPNHRVAFITSCGGRSIVKPDVWQQVEDWCKSLGATKIQAWAKDAQARLYRQSVGFTPVCNVVEKAL